MWLDKSNTIPCRIPEVLVFLVALACPSPPGTGKENTEDEEEGGGEYNSPM